MSSMHKDPIGPDIIGHYDIGHSVGQEDFHEVNLQQHLRSHECVMSLTLETSPLQRITPWIAPFFLCRFVFSVRTKNMRRFQHIAWSLFEVVHLPLLMVRWRSSTLAVLGKMRAFHDPKGLYRCLEHHGAWSRCKKKKKRIKTRIPTIKIQLSPNTSKRLKIGSPDILKK